MKFFISKISTHKGYKWYLFIGDSQEKVIDFMEFQKHPLLANTLKELSYDEYKGFKKVLNLKTIIVSD